MPTATPSASLMPTTSLEPTSTATPSASLMPIVDDIPDLIPEKIPKLVFIIPYRNREQQQSFFANHMSYVLSDMSPDDYKIYYIHQCDNREFNRGAMKNIGFITIKNKYPNDYQNITIVFNDVDTMPLTKNFFHYETIPGIIKHFYGYEFALGGIVSICGEDFEKVNGFPNYWAWGYEDNLLNIRVKEAGLHIDRSQFYPIMDKNIMQLKDGLLRVVNKKEFDRYIQKTKEGISSIHNLHYQIDEENGFIHVRNFFTEYIEDKRFTKNHDLRNGSRPFAPNQPTRVLRGANVSMKMLI
jgi:hypothetical protein